MRPAHKLTHLRSGLRLLKRWHLLFVATLTFGDLLTAGPRLRLLRPVADEHRQGKANSGMKRRYRSLLAGLLFATLLYGASPALAQSLLGTAQSFAVLGGSAVTNTGPTIVNGDLGVSPGSAITGFPPGIVIGGTIHANDAVAMQAQNDVTTAYNALAGMACNTDLTGQDLGGLTLTPGVYCFSSSAQLTGTLTLDAQGNPNAVFIFKIGSTLTTASNSSVQVINGGQICNVFWQVGSSATLGTDTAFAGNILALTSITLNTGASILGRALARNGAVTMNNNTITAPGCSVVPPGTTAPPSIGVAFSPAIINAGGVSTKTITLSNPNSSPAVLTAALTDTLPAGLVVSGTPGTTCGGMVTATATMVTLAAGSTIPGGTPGTPGTCTVTFNVTAASAGNYLNTLPAGALQTSNGNNAAPAVATLTVVPASGPPLLSKAFSPATINAGGVSTLSITLINPNGSPATLTAPLTDTLPAGLVIADTPNASTTCGGVVSAPAGGNTVTLPAGSMIPGGSPGTCTVTVNVTTALGGNYLNTLPAGALQTSNGNNAAPAVATLTVVPLPFPVPSPISDDRAGSVLIFPIYTSSLTNPAVENTRINITNTDNGASAFVHLFFVDSASCSVSDNFLCLTPNQTMTILASDVDPGVTGYVIAVATDSAGCPTNFNRLIGDAYVKFQSGQAANLGAVAVPALAGGLPFCDATSATATLAFNNVSYHTLPRVLALDNIASALDGNSTMLVIDRIGGDLRSTLGNIGPVFGIVFDQLENPFSFQFNGGCQFRSFLNGVFPRTTPRLGSIIPAGSTGWMKFFSTDGNAIVGAALNFNPAAGTNPNAFNQGHNLHVLDSTTASLTIPVFPAGCQ